MTVAFGNMLGLEGLKTETVYAASSRITDVTVTASSFVKPFSPDRAINVNADPTQALTASRWYCTNSGDKWLQLDLKKSYSIDKWRVENLGSLGWDIAANTKNYQLQSSNDGTNWTNIQTITNNTSNITENQVTAFSARYVRLNITQGNQSNNLWASVADFCVYGVEEYSVGVAALTGGTITATPAKSISGSTINLSIVPDTGMQLKSGSLKYTYNSTTTAINGTSFVMPAANVVISAEFEPKPTVSSVAVTPATVTLAKRGETHSFTATVVGENNPAQTVLWSVSGNTSSNTVISDTGALTIGADENASQIRVRAVSTVDSSKVGTAEVTVYSIKTITLATTAGGSVSSTGGTALGNGIYEAMPGAKMTLVATPEVNQFFDGWYDSSNNKVSSSSIWSISVTESAQYTAKFAASLSATLAISFEGIGNYSVNGAYGIPLYIGIIGVPVTVEAIEIDPNFSFLYWVDQNNRVVSTDRTYNFILTGNTILKAVFQIKTPIERKVVFQYPNGEIIQSSYSPMGMSVAMPTTIPYRYGYTFSGWDKTEVEITTAVTDIVVTAMFTKNPVVYNITVNGGSGTGSYEIKQLVTAVADAAPAGQKFSHWLDSAGNILSYDATYKFYATASTSITSVYVVDSEIIEPQATINITSVTSDVALRKITFVAERNIPEGSTLVDTGIIITKNSAVGTSDVNFVIGGTDVLKGTSKNLNLKGTYVVNKMNVNIGETWYARGYIIYKDKNGSLITIYSEVKLGSM